MTDQTDVKATRLAATGAAVTQRTRVKGLTLTSTAATAGSAVLRTNGASGTTLLQIDTPAALGVFHILIPGEGIVFPDDVHATLTNVTATVFYG
jgi:hypothetical protein